MALQTSKPDAAPSVVVLAGPNGAGKSTAAPLLLRGGLAVQQFVNADTIAYGLAAYAPETAAIAAGRIMLARLDELAAQRVSFAFETTLAGRSFAPWLRQLADGGYRVQLVFLWLPSADLAVARVASRVRFGGHHVPEQTVRRRFAAGLANLRRLYQPLASSWRVYDSADGHMRLIAAGENERVLEIGSPSVRQQICSEVAS